MMLKMRTVDDRTLTTAVSRSIMTESGGSVPSKGDQTLSVIIRFHQKDRLPFLEEAIFSLAIQDWGKIETIVVIQNGTEEIRQAVVDIINRQPWPEAPPYSVQCIAIPQGVDGRSTLLNEGIAIAMGRYLAFLDDDDFVYQHAYATLIGQLVCGGRAIAIGGCRRANIRYARNHWYVQSKDNFFSWGRSRLDLFMENFVPIHSYVIDRARIGSFELYFDDACPPLEDYDFLLRLFATFDPDLSQIDVPVCEYRIRMDGSNSIAYVPNAPPEVVKKQTRAQQLIRARKKTLIQQMPAEHQRKLKETVCRDLFDEPDMDTPAQAEPARRVDEDSIACLPGTADQRAGMQSAEQQRVLLQLTHEVYLFFSNHPWWELQLSRMLHRMLRVYRRRTRV